MSDVFVLTMQGYSEDDGQHFENILGVYSTPEEATATLPSIEQWADERYGCYSIVSGNVSYEITWYEVDK